MLTDRDQLRVLGFAPGTGDVEVSLERLIPSRALITGDSRTGKSHLMRQLLEQTYGHVAHLIIDPEGEYYTLREQFDYLLVGRGGELAADPETAATLARRLFALRASAIISLSDLKPKVQQEYIAAFLPPLLEVHQEEGHPTIVVVDEVQRFAAEGGKSASHDALWDLGTRGGKRGVCLIAVTHRISDLSKSVAAGLSNRFIFRTTLDTDVERSGRSLGFRTRDQRDQLMQLEDGECFAYGPAIGTSRGVQRLRSVEQTATTHVDVTRGARPAAPPPRAALQGLVEELRDVAQQAAEERSELEQLRAKVTRLEQERATTPAPVIDQAAIDREVARAVAAEGQRHDRVRRILRTGAQAILTSAMELVAASEAVIAGVDEGWIQPVPDPAHAESQDGQGVSRSPSTPLKERQTAPVPSDLRPAAVDDPDIDAGEQRILDAFAEMLTLGIRSATRLQLGLFAGYNLTVGGKGARYLGSLIERGFVVESRERELTLTVAGDRRARRPASPPSNAALQARVLDRLDEGERRLLAWLISVHPRPQTREALGSACSYNLTVGGKGAGYVRRLVALGLVDELTDRRLRASAVLFPRTESP